MRWCLRIKICSFPTRFEELDALREELEAIKKVGKRGGKLAESSGIIYFIFP